MTLSFASISETALTELPSSGVVSDLEIVLYGDNSFAFTQPESTLTLVLSNTNDIVYTVQYGGTTSSWIAPLIASASDTVETIYSFVETINLEFSVDQLTSSTFVYVDSSSIELAAEVVTTTRYEQPAGTATFELSFIDYPALQTFDIRTTTNRLQFRSTEEHNIYLHVTDPANFVIDAFEKQFEEIPPGELWRNRPGLPIGTLSFNPIGVEQQVDFPYFSYPDFSTGTIEVTAITVATSATVSDVTPSELIFGDAGTQSSTRQFFDTGNLTTINISDIVVSMYAETSGGFDIGGTDLISRRAVYYDNAPLEVFPNQSISIIYGNISSGLIEVEARTYAKEYTFLKQFSYNDTVGINLIAESSESLRINAGGTTAPRQVWFG